MDIKAILESLKLSRSTYFAIAIVSGFLSWAPVNLLRQFGLYDFRTRFQVWISLIFLCSAALFASSIGAELYGEIRKRVAWFNTDRQFQDRIKNLSKEEKEVLRSYMEGNTKTMYFPLQDGVISGLELGRIIYRSSDVGDLYGDGFPYNLQPWAWKYLKQHPEVLSISSDTLAPEEKPAPKRGSYQRRPPWT